MIKVGSQYAQSNREYAVEFVKSILPEANDWQDAQHALANHPTIGPWLRGAFADVEDGISEAQNIIRLAEDELLSEGAELRY